MSDLRQPGRVNRYFSNYYYVTLTDGPQAGREVQAMARGLLRKQGLTVLAGDGVWLEDWEQDTAWIVAIDPRRNELDRPRIANIDQVLVVMPWRQPTFDGRQLDRTLTLIALHGLPAALAITKTDLALAEDDSAEGLAALNAMRQHYEWLNYPVFGLSTKNDDTAADWLALRHWLDDAQTVLAGVSGAGKSSLLNTLKPGLNLRVNDVSARIERGQHTTRTVSLLELAPGAWVADTPGFSLTRLTGFEPAQVEAVFAEFAPWRGACEYANCLHQQETGCAVNGAVLAGQLSGVRLGHYRELVSEADADSQVRSNQSSKQDPSCKQLDRKGQQNLSITRLNERHRATSRRRQRQEVIDIESDPDDDDTGEDTLD